MTKSVVIPFVASAIIAVQSAAARSAGVRPRPARNFALYDRRSFMKSVRLISTVCESQSSGIGKPPLPVVAAGLLAMLIAESRLWSATAMTSDALDSGGMVLVGTAAVTIAAES